MIIIIVIFSIFLSSFVLLYYDCYYRSTAKPDLPPRKEAPPRSEDATADLAKASLVLLIAQLIIATHDSHYICNTQQH